MKKRTPNPEREKTQVRIAEKVAGALHWLQTKWATRMGRISQRLSLRQRKIVFVLCCLFMALYSSALVAFSFKKNNPLIDAPVRISMPAAVLKPPGKKEPAKVPAFLLPIQRAHRYLDSLGNTESGRRLRDSLLRGRPGLMDSIRLAERAWCQNP